MIKRDFLKGMATLSMVGTLGGLKLIHGNARPPAERYITAVIYDQRYSDAIGFASVLEKQGATPFETNQDTVQLWYQGLHEHIKRAPDNGVRLAGLTTASDLLILKSYAAENRLKLQYQGVHDCRGANMVTHTLTHYAGEGLDIATISDLACPDWAQILAYELNNSKLDGKSQSKQRSVTKSPRSEDHPGSLVSWVIS